jgi:glyoxylase I family protein
MTAPAVDGVHHAAIAVRDLAKLEPFYTQVLGLPVLRRWPQADAPGQWRSVWLDLGGGAFLALERTGDVDQGGAARAATGYLMIALRIAPLARAEWEARFAAAGVAIAHRTDYTLYVDDPEGNRVGLSHWPEPQAPKGR